MIQYNNGVITYYDKHGVEITEGCRIKFPGGRIERIYRTQDGELGWDATNPNWIAKGWAVPCEYGVYPLSSKDCAEAEVLR